MKRSAQYFFVFIVLFFSTFLTKAQLPYTCDFLPRIAVAGDSWAQYMADDGTYASTLKMYGHGDKGFISETFEISIGCTGTPGSNDYAVSGSEARQWADEANYDYLQNLIDALNDNPSVNYVVLSIGGNDILAARSGGGWYKNMDMDEAASEQALFNTITAHTQYIMDEIWSRANANIKFIISSYDFPNFNVVGSFLGFNYCEQYACPKREDLSRDDNGNGQIDTDELITDAEINAMMNEVEGIRKSMADGHPNILYDNGMGLMHYYYGFDDPGYPAFPSGEVDYPQGESPYATGGDLGTPTDRENFRGVALCGLIGDFPADPIHLDEEGYQFKIKNQFDNIFFEDFRGLPDETFWSVGSEDGYVDVLEETATSDGIRIGDNDTGFPFSLNNEYRGILSFDTEVLPDNAVVTGASLYIIRSGENDNPFFFNDRNPVLDIKNGYFGDDVALVWTDGDLNAAAADATNIGCFHGQADENKWAIRVDLDEPALEHVNLIGTTQLRMYFDYADFSPEYINFYDGDGVAALLPPEVAARNNPTKYKTRTVRRSTGADGLEREEVIGRGEPIIEREGFVYQEKLKGVSTDDNGDVVLSFVVVVALEHPGLAKHMSETYGAPADGYAPFLDVTYQLPLPVELLDFRAEAKENASWLGWQTASESDSKGFHIEHSLDGREWSVLGFVSAQGQSSDLQQYSYIHENPMSGDNYYRLRMVDLDGRFEYSVARLVHFEKEYSLLSVHPNPFSDQLKIRMGGRISGAAIVQLTDVFGRIVLERVIVTGKGEEELRLNDLNNLSKGAYFLRISNREESLSWKLYKK